MPLPRGEYTATLESFVVWEEVHTLKSKIEKSKRARDFLLAHDSLPDFGMAEFELIVDARLPRFLEKAVVSSGSVDVGKLKRLMGVWSFKK